MAADPTLPPEMLARMGTARTAADVSEWLTGLNPKTELDPVTLGRILNKVRVDADAETVIRKVSARPLYLLGHGAMGEVRAAHDPALRRFVAIKSMKPTASADPALIGRFIQEALITAQLDHPGIVPVYALQWDERGRPAYVMKLVRGQTLKAFLLETRAALDAGGKLDDAHALPARLEIFIKIVDAIQYAHSRGVLHRDLKPDNIMVGEFGEVLVMDWGLARTIEGRDTLSVDLDRTTAGDTSNGTLVGTPRYMAPEQALARNDLVSVRTDVYGLGLLLFETVTLRPALDGDSRDDVLLRASRSDLLPIVSVEKVSRDLRAVIAKATAHNPRDRYQDAGGLAADLHRVLRDEAVSVRKQSRLERTLRWISHNRELTLAGILALVILLFAMATLLASGGLVALEAYRREGAVQEERLASLLTAVGGQGAHVNDELQSYEKLLAYLAGAAVLALEGPVPERETWLVADFDAGRVPDLGPSPVYGGNISLDHLDHAVATGIDPASVRGRMQQLEGIQPLFREVLLRSGGDDLLGLSDPAWRLRIRGDGTTRRRLPMVWAYVATSEGVVSGYPAMGRYPEPYDPRAQPWYRIVASKDGDVARTAKWGPALPDESGMGLLVSASQPLYAPDGRFLGVAAVDISIDAMVADLLDPSRFDDPVQAWLIQRDGSVVVSSAWKGAAQVGQFPWPDIAALVAAGRRSGTVQHDGMVIAWCWLDALGWTYVVAGKEEEWLGD